MQRLEVVVDGGRTELDRKEDPLDGPSPDIGVDQSRDGPGGDQPGHHPDPDPGDGVGADALLLCGADADTMVRERAGDGADVVTGRERIGVLASTMEPDPARGDTIPQSRPPQANPHEPLTLSHNDPH